MHNYTTLIYIADGVDYFGVSEDLVFAASSDMNTEREFTFTVVNDNLCEGDETVALEGSNLCNRGTFAGGALVVITDDDGKQYCWLFHEYTIICPILYI